MNCMRVHFARAVQCSRRRACADYMQACVQCVYISSSSYFCSPHLFTLFLRCFIFPSTLTLSSSPSLLRCYCYCYFFPVPRTGWNIRTLSCHFRRRVQFPEVSSVGNAFNIYCLLFFSILISSPSFTHSLLHSTIAAEDATPTVKFHKFSRFSQTKRFHSCIKYIARECQKVRGGVMH